MAVSFQLLTGPLTLSHCLSEALAHVDSPVLSGQDQAPTSGATLVSAMRAARSALLEMGITPSDRIAYALPDSPATALLSMTIMSTAIAAPVNSKIVTSELQNTLRNLRVSSVVLPAGVDSNARRAARELGLHTIEHSVVPGSYAGHFELRGRSIRDTSSSPREHSDEHAHALVVQTSGTTGMQKIVALTHRNLLSMMLANCERLELSGADRCVGMMPLFHIHGLGAVICTLLSGGMIHILPEFDADRFYQSLVTIRPSWYTAVPTIHQNILRAASNHTQIVEQVAASKQLRFVRSGSAPMPAGVPEQLERLFNTRYVEAAGATECSAYICSNSPSDRRIGSVGRPMPGNDVRILSSGGSFLGPDEEGEIVTRGPGVFAGYEGQPQLNAEAFHDGYFRTGDLGRYDKDGYFYLTGRLKEQINRGGMKISPREVDDVLARHPAVHAAVTFAVKDAALGEEVHAAIVLKKDSVLTSLDLQRFAAEHLADYKVPRQFHFVASLPTNAVGKIVRVNMAALLGLDRNSATAPPVQLPETPTELAVAAMFTRILGCEVENVHLDFRAAGGDSVDAMNLSLEMERHFGRSIPVSAISGNSTVAQLAGLIESDGWAPTPSAPVVFRAPCGEHPTLFCLPGVGGNVWCYSGVASALHESQPVVGLPLPGTDGLEEPIDDIAKLAGRFVQSIRSIQPHGPYLLTGYSFGGRVAYEVCQRLASAGEVVASLILIDTAGPNWPKPLSLRRRLFLHACRLISQGPIAYLRRIRSRHAGTFGLMPEEILDVLKLQNASESRQQAQMQLISSSARASQNWRPDPAAFPITVVHAYECSWTDSDVSDTSMGWSALAKGRFYVDYVSGSHGTMFHEPNVGGLANAIASAIRSSL